MRPKTEPLASGACRLNAALAVLEAIAAAGLAITIMQEVRLDGAFGARVAFAWLFVAVLAAAAVVHGTFSVLARQGRAGPALTMTALTLGFLMVPWGTGVAIYTWMRLDDPTVKR